MTDVTERTAPTTSTAPSVPEVLDEVRVMITDIVGEDYLLDLEIDMETSFADDLEVESLEFVALAEKLTDRYGERIDFVGWLAEMELDDIIGMTVGLVVDFVHASISGSGEETPDA